MHRAFSAVALAALAACSGGGNHTLTRAAGTTSSSSTSASTSTLTSTTSRAATTTARATSTTRSTMPGPVVIRYRVERHADDEATANFQAVVDATLNDPRGWTRAGFVLQRADDAPYTILLAEGPDGQERGRPCDT